jgi:hypothetical protein
MSLAAALSPVFFALEFPACLPLLHHPPTSPARARGWING